MNLILGPDLVTQTDVFVKSIASAAGCPPGSAAAEAEVLRGQVSALDGIFNSCEITITFNLLKKTIKKIGLRLAVL